MSGDDEDEGEAHLHVSQPLLYQLSNTATVVESTVECKCFELETAIVFHFPMERFFTRRAGPPVTAWQERHAEEDFLALVRHNAGRRGASGSRALTSSAHRPCATGWPRSRRTQRSSRKRSGQSGGATACRYSVEGVHRQKAPRLPQQWSLQSRSGHTTSHHEICGSGWWTTHCCATCRDGTTG